MFTYHLEMKKRWAGLCLTDRMTHGFHHNTMLPHHYRVVGYKKEKTEGEFWVSKSLGHLPYYFVQ